MSTDPDVDNRPGRRPLRVGVVITSTEHGGAEANIARIWTDERIAARANALLLGSLPRWHETGLPHLDLGLGAKWSYRRAMRSVLAMPTTVMRARRTIAAAHRAQPFDAFYVHFKREQVLLTRWLARRAPVIWMEHGHLPGGRLERPLKWAYRRAAGHTRSILCLSDSVRDEIQRTIGAATADLVVLENSIDPAWASPARPGEQRAARARLGIPDDSEPVLAVVARLIPRKRIELAIDAARVLDSSWLIICGAGPLEAELRDRSADNPRVIFTGFVADPRPVYAAADVLLLLSWEEGFGHVLLEGAAAGLPAVVVRDGGFAERVAGWGAVADEPTPEAVVSAIERALRLPRSAARAWAEAHGPDSWANAHLDVLDRAVR